MTRQERLQYEMLLRVRDFGTAHRQQFPDETMGGKAFRAVSDALPRIQAHATTKVLTAEEGTKAKAAARETMVAQMMAIARTARLMAKRAPGSDAVFHVPDQGPDTALLTAARAFIREGQKAIDRFVLLGLPKTFVANLQEATDAFEQAVHGRRVGRSGLAAAQAGIKTALAEAMDAVHTLDVVVSNTLENDPVTLAVWKRDRRVNPKTKPAPVARSAKRTQTQQPAAPVEPAATQAPTAPSVAAPQPAAADDLDRRAS